MKAPYEYVPSQDKTELMLRARAVCQQPRSTTYPSGVASEYVRGVMRELYETLLRAG